MMPLGLIERVLPWFVRTMNDGEAQSFLHNIQLAGSISFFFNLITCLEGKCTIVKLILSISNTSFVYSFSAPDSDTCLVLLFCNWARNVRSQDLCKSSRESCCKHIKRSLLSHEDFAQSSTLLSKPYFLRRSCLFPASEVNKTNLNLSPIVSFGWVEQPIDIIFKVHKAIRRDLEYLSVESGKIRDGDEAFLHQFIGRFCLFWGLYKAHSNSEDNIIYPALESKEALRNVTHSYSFDHEQEETLLEEISCVLSELSQALRRLKSVDIKKDSSEGAFELSTKLQVMFNSIKVIIDQHIFREEHKLWPLLRCYFSKEEQNKMVGFVLGTTGAVVLQLLLPWVTSALTQDEQNKMMDGLKQVAKNTMFSDWLSECSKGNSVSMLQTHISEACVSQKGTS